MTKVSAKQKIVESYLEDKVSKGVWPPDGRLPPERSLAQELGVCRNTIRTAIKTLCGRGVLVSRHNSGTYVAGRKYPLRSAAQELGDRVAGFALLFPKVARLAVENIEASDIAGLETLLSPLGVAVNFGTGKEFCNAQMQFIEGVVAATRNLQVAAAMEALVPKGKHFVFLINATRKTQQEKMFASLAQMLGAIRRVDADGAEEQAQMYADCLIMLMKPAP